MLAFGKSKYTTRLKLLAPFGTTEERDRALREELERVHNEAIQRLQEEDEPLDTFMITQAIQNEKSIAERLMSETDIVKLYLLLLKQLPENSRQNLREILLEKI